jgi:two-component system, NarL family, sensor histidine kinase UhpB
MMPSGKKLFRNTRPFRFAGIILYLMLLSVHTSAQQPDWSQYADSKERLNAIRNYGRDLIKKQQYDQAVTVFKTGLDISRKESLDSFTCASLTLLGTAYRYKGRYDSAFYFYDLAEKIAVAKKYIVLQAFIQIESYAIFNRTGKADSAAVAISRMQDLLPELDSSSSESAKIEMYLGHDDKHKTKYTEALEHYYRALRIFSYIKDSVNEGTMYVSLANVLVLLGQTEKALVYHQQAVELFTMMGRRFELVNELLNITDLYISTLQLDSAENSVRKALSIIDTINNKSYLGNAYVDLGYIYKHRKKFKESKDYFQQAIYYGEADKNNTMLMDSYQGIGEMYMADHKPELAMPFLEKHLSLAKQESDKEEIMEASLNLAENENTLHHYAKAYEYQKLYNTYKDSSYTETTAKSMAEMESKYQAEKKEKEISLLRKDQQLDRLNLQKQKNFRLGAVIFLLLLLLIAFLVINRYRVLQRSKRLIEMERMRNTIARNLHDDIGSTLSSINILSKVALQQQPAGAMGINMQKIKDRSAAVMESMSDIVWAINPQHDTFEQMLLRMKEFTAEMLEPLNINYTFKESGNFSAIRLDVEKRKDFYLLFKEAVNNAAKYSQCKNITILLKQDQQLIHLTIADDGTGFDLQHVKMGNGISNMRMRAAAMKASIQIDTAKNEGTRIAVDIPIT